MRRLRTTPWTTLLLGEDPLPTLLLLVAVTLLLPPFASFWPILILLLGMALLFRVWLICHPEEDREGE